MLPCTPDKSGKEALVVCVCECFHQNLEKKKAFAGPIYLIKLKFNIRVIPLTSSYCNLVLKAIINRERKTIEIGVLVCKDM